MGAVGRGPKNRATVMVERRYAALGPSQERFAGEPGSSKVLDLGHWVKARRAFGQKVAAQSEECNLVAERYRPADAPNPARYRAPPEDWRGEGVAGAGEGSGAYRPEDSPAINIGELLKND